MSRDYHIRINSEKFKKLFGNKYVNKIHIMADKRDRELFNQRCQHYIMDFVKEKFFDSKHRTRISYSLGSKNGFENHTITSESYENMELLERKLDELSSKSFFYRCCEFFTVKKIVLVGMFLVFTGLVLFINRERKQVFCLDDISPIDFFNFIDNNNIKPYKYSMMVRYGSDLSVLFFSKSHETLFKLTFK